MLRVILGSLLIAGMSGPSWAQDVTYRKHIQPLVAQKCGGCHGAGSPYYGDFSEDKKKYEAALKGPRMDSYADLIFFIGWPDASTTGRTPVTGSRATCTTTWEPRRKSVRRTSTCSRNG